MSVDWHSRGFHVLAIVNISVINVGVHISFQISVFFPPDIYTQKVRLKKKKKQIRSDITYKWNLKNNTNKCICTTEIDRKQTNGYQGCKTGVWDLEMQTIMFKIDKQQEYIV